MLPILVWPHFQYHIIIKLLPGAVLQAPEHHWGEVLFPHTILHWQRFKFHKWNLELLSFLLIKPVINNLCPHYYPERVVWVIDAYVVNFRTSWANSSSKVTWSEQLVIFIPSKLKLSWSTMDWFQSLTISFKPWFKYFPFPRCILYHISSS